MGTPTPTPQPPGVVGINAPLGAPVFGCSNVPICSVTMNYLAGCTGLKAHKHTNSD